jgi:hypothetical protein
LKQKTSKRCIKNETFRDQAIQGVPKKRKLLKALIVKFDECPTKQLNVMMRKILTRCMHVLKFS